MFSIVGPGWDISNLEAVIFDKDGTLVDIHLYWGEIVKRRSAAAIGHYHLDHTLLPGLCLAMGFSLTDNRVLPQGPVGLASREEVVQCLRDCLAGLGVATSTESVAAIFAHVHDAFLPDIDRYLNPISGTAIFLSSLQQIGAKMAIVTSDTQINTRKTLERFEINNYFAAIVGRDTIPEPKISGMPAKKAMELLGGYCETTVCIGDAPMDILMARASGCCGAIGIATGQTPIDELRKYTPYVAASMRDLSIRL